MDRTRVALGAAVLGFALVALGFVVTPGLVSKTAVACSSSEPAAFHGFAGASLVWYDGCNDWLVSVPAVLGVVSLAVSACLGVATFAPRVREAVANGR